MKQTRNNIKEKSIATMLLMTMALLFSNDMISSDHSLETSTPGVLEMETKNILEGPIEPIQKLNIVPQKIELVENKKQALKDPFENKRNLNLNLGHVPTSRDTVPERNSRISIHTESNGKVMKMEKENGNITRLEIDGKVIPKSEYDDYKEFTDDVIVIDGNEGGSRMMFFGNGDGSNRFDFKFDSLFNGSDFSNIFKNLEMQENFVFPDIQNLDEMMLRFDQEGFPGKILKMERFQDLMENMDGNEFRFDSLFEFDLDNFNNGGNELRFFFDKNDNEDSFKWNNDGGLGSNKVVDVLGKELNRDGLLEPYKTNKVELTGKYLKINGDKQPKNIWGKYKRIYEQQTGMTMSKKARVDFSVEGKESNRRIRSF